MFIAMHEEVSRFLKTCRSKNTSASYAHVLRRLADWMDSNALALPGDCGRRMVHKLNHAGRPIGSRRVLRKR